MPRGNYSQGTLDLRHGARVRIRSGPHAGASGDITSILVERGVTYYQVAFVGESGERLGEGGLFQEGELVPRSPA
jgi:hypothetical protein